MTIIEDTSQKKGMHEIKADYFKSAGVSVVRCRLPYGDYVIAPDISIDTKRNMEEIAQNINQDHARFRNECKLAQASGARLIVLVENEDGITCVDEVHTWENPNIIYRPRETGARLEKAMKTMHERYGVEFQFCTPQEAGKRIVELLKGNTDEQ